MKTLDEIGLCDRTDKSSPYHNYLNTYEKYFKEFRDVPCIDIWELGIGDINSANKEGESAFVWQEYFHGSSIIRVFDNDLIKTQRFVNRGNIIAHHLDQTDKKGFEDLVRKTTAPTIIIDDASHIQSNTIKSFEILFPLLQSGGLYCVEDTITSYWPDWGGSSNLWDLSANTIMNYMFQLCTTVNLKRQETFNPPQDYPIMTWEKQIDSIHFHHSQIIIRKK